MLLGREREIETLQENYEIADHGNARIVLVRGEAGIGKTALVKEFLRGKGCTVLEGKCSPILTPALQPFKEALGSINLDYLLGIPENPKLLMLYAIHNTGLLLSKVENVDFHLDADIFTSMLTAVGMFVKDSLSELGTGAEYLEELKYGEFNLVVKMGNLVTLVAVMEGKSNGFLHRDLKNLIVEVEEKYGEVLKAWDGNTESVAGIEKMLRSMVESGKYDGRSIDTSVKDWNFENVRLGLHELSTKNLVCVFMDDIQWADEATLSLMHYLARSEEDRFLIVGTYRSEEITEELKNLEEAVIREGIGDIIQLMPLKRDEIISLMENTLSGEISLNLLEYVESSSGGVPLNIIEITKMLQEEDFIEMRDGKYQLKKDPEKLPTKIESIVERRMRLMDDDEREVVEFSSVIGDKIIVDTLTCGLEMKKIKLIKILRKLLKCGILKSEDDGYFFRHNYVRETIYRSIDSELRSAYHEMAGECLESLDIDLNVKATVLAEHYYRAGKCKRAMELAKVAMENATKNYAFGEALKYGKIALSCAEKGDVENIHELLLKIGALHLKRGEFQDAIVSYERCLEIKESPEAHIGLGETYFQIGEYDMAMKHYTAAESLMKYDREKLLINIANVEMRRGNLNEAEELLKSYVEWAKVNEDKIRGYKALGLFYTRTERYELAESILLKALELAEAANMKLQMADLLHNISLLYFLQGKNDNALREALRAMDIRDGVGEIRGISKTSNLLGLIYWNLGEIEQSKRYFSIALKYAKLLGMREDMASPLTNIGMISYYSGDYEGAERNLKEAISILDEVGSMVRVLDPLLYLASLYMDMRKDVCGEIMKRSRSIVEKIGMANYSNWYSILECRMKGDVECMRKVMGEIEDPLLLAIAHQHMWKLTGEEEERKLAMKLFADAKFMGALTYFR